MINIYNKDRVKIAMLQNAFEIRREENLNSINYLYFTLPYNDKKAELCQFGCYAQYNDDGQLHRILPVQTDIDEVGNISYTCEHAFSLLIKSFLIGEFELTPEEYTVTEAINFLFSHQNEADWVLDECDFTEHIGYYFADESLLSAILKITEFFQEDFVWKFDTSVYPFVASLKRIQLDTTEKISLRVGDNVVRLSRRSDYSEVCTRIFPRGNNIDITSVNEGVNYLLAPQEFLDKYGLIDFSWPDTRFTDPAKLKQAAATVLERKQDVIDEYEIDFVDLPYNITPEVGSPIDIIGFKVTFVTGISYDDDELRKSVIRVSDQPKNIAVKLADVIEKQDNTQKTFNFYLPELDKLKEYPPVEDLVDDVKGKLEEEGFGEQPFDFWIFSYGFVESNVDAIDVTKERPADGIRRFYRMDENGLSRISSVLAEDSDPTTEPAGDDEKGHLYFLSPRGQNIYWTEIPEELRHFDFFVPDDPEDPEGEGTEKPVVWTALDHEPYTTASVLSPLKQRQITFPSGITTEQKAEIEQEVMARYAVKVRKQTETVLWKITDLEDDTVMFVKNLLSGENSTEIGFRITDEPEYSEKQEDGTYEWKKVGSGTGSEPGITSVYTDGVTIIGDGTATNPLTATGGASGVVIEDRLS